MIQFLIALALCYVLIKIPFWVLGSLRGGGSRSMVGSLVRGLIAYKTFGLVRRFTTEGASSSPRRSQRTPAGDGAATEARGGGRNVFSALNPVAAFRRRHQRRWADPEPGMLPMKLRRPKMAHEMGTQRPSLGDELDDPDRVMPWQQESPSYTPGLLSPRGGINPKARRERNPRKVEHPERGMLNLMLRHNSRGVSTGVTVGRRRLAEDVDDPQRQPPTAGLQPSRTPAQTPRRKRPQQALLNDEGQVTQNARARQPRRPARSTPAQQKQSQQQQRGGSDRG